MNNAAKWTMIVGGVLFGLGILFTVLSSMGLSDLEPDENWVPDESSWNGETGVFEALEERGRGEGEEVSYLVFVKDRSNSISDQCQDFSLTINNTNEESLIREPEWIRDWCDESGDRPWGGGDDPPGYWHLGKISKVYVGQSYEISASEEIYLVHEDLIGDIIGDAIGGIIGASVSSGCACCGFFVMIIGIIMALTMENETGPTQFQVDEQGRVILNQGAVFETAEAPGFTEITDPGEVAKDDAEAWYKQN